MQTGGYVAITLIAVEIVLVFSLALGKAAMSKGLFAIASAIIVFAAAFFWMNDRITELTISGVGTIKTAATLATQYVEDIKNIKTEVEQQKQEITTAVDTLKREIDAARAETQKS